MESSTDANRTFRLCHREGRGWDLLAGIVNLDATGISWENDQQSGRLEYDAIGRVCLFVAAAGDSPLTGHCTVTAGDRHFCVGSAGSFCNTKDGAAQYVEFVHSLHRSLSACAKPIAFVTLPKVRPMVVWLLLAGFAAFLGLVIIIPRLTGMAGDSLSLWLPLLLALLVYEIAMAFKTRETQHYHPDNIPSRLLP